MPQGCCHLLCPTTAVVKKPSQAQQASCCSCVIRVLLRTWPGSHPLVPLQAYGDSDSDEDWLDEDSDDEASSLPLDNLDVFSAFAQALAGMQVEGCQANRLSVPVSHSYLWGCRHRLLTLWGCTLGGHNSHGRSCADCNACTQPAPRPLTAQYLGSTVAGGSHRAACLAAPHMAQPRLVMSARMFIDVSVQQYVRSASVLVASKGLASPQAAHPIRPGLACWQIQHFNTSASCKQARAITCPACGTCLTGGSLYSVNSCSACSFTGQLH